MLSQHAEMLWFLVILGDIRINLVGCQFSLRFYCKLKQTIIQYCNRACGICASHIVLNHETIQLVAGYTVLVSVTLLIPSFFK